MKRMHLLCISIAVAALAAPAARADSLQAAAGLSMSWQQRRDYGETIRGAIVPELVGLLYVGTPRERLYLRPGVRLGYAGLQQPDMPMAIRVREHDVVTTAELGILYDGPVIPSVTVGGGVVSRSIQLEAAPPVEADGEGISRWQALPLGFVQLGAGIPLARGRALVEPFVRFELIPGDQRAWWRYGLDLTLQL